MSTKQIISFCGGLFLTASFYFLIILFFFGISFSFAGERIDEKETRDAFFFYTTILVISVTVYACYRWFKANRKSTAAGIAIPIVFALYISMVTGQEYWRNLNYHQQFNPQSWMQPVLKPFKMAKTMTKSGILIGLTKQQVIEKLGTPQETVNNGQEELLTYGTDKQNWQLRLSVKNNRVVEAFLFEPGLAI